VGTGETPPPPSMSSRGPKPRKGLRARPKGGISRDHCPHGFVSPDPSSLSSGYAADRFVGAPRDDMEDYDALWIDMSEHEVLGDGPSNHDACHRRREAACLIHVIPRPEAP